MAVEGEAPEAGAAVEEAAAEADATLVDACEAAEERADWVLLETSM